MRVAVMARGTSPHVQEWLAFWAADGWDVHLLTFDPADIPGVTVHALRRRFRLRGGAAYVGGRSQACRILAELQPSILVVYYITGYGLLATLTGFAPVALFVAGSDVQLTVSSRLRRGLIWFILRRAAFVQVPAEHLERQVRRLGYSGPVVALPRGVDCELHPLKVCHRDEHLIVSTRNHFELYDVATLIRAFGRLAPLAPRARLLVVGDGPLHESLRNLAERLEVSKRCTFVGTQSRDQIFEFLATATIYVSTSRSDGASVSLFEAMLYGAFPVVSDIEANRSFIHHGCNGRLFPPGDDAALADAILHVFAQGDLVAVTAANRELVRSRADANKNLRRLGGALRALVTGHLSDPQLTSDKMSS